MANFNNTLSPTPFGFFDSDSHFQTEADAMVTFVKRRLGDDILSVELTKKQIWACFEEAFCTYGAIINQYQAKSQMASLMGFATGTLTGAEQKLPRENFEFALRRAEPYAMEAGLGGAYRTLSGSIELEAGRQDYDIYEELKDMNGAYIVSSSFNSPTKKLKIQEVFHFNPSAAYRFFDTTSAVNYLNNEFNFESFTPETVFYVLPVFEDVLRGGMLSMSQRVRRSNFSYKITGTKIRIFQHPLRQQRHQSGCGFVSLLHLIRWTHHLRMIQSMVSAICQTFLLVIFYLTELIQLDGSGRGSTQLHSAKKS